MAVGLGSKEQATLAQYLDDGRVCVFEELTLNGRDFVLETPVEADSVYHW